MINQVILKNGKVVDIKQLENFYYAIAKLTSNHDCIGDYACVTADKLGKELEKIDYNWWKMK